MKSNTSPRWPKMVWTTVATGIGLTVLTAGTGCQVDVGGQTLPSAYYLLDDVQYFAPGPWFKLQEEADAQDLYRRNRELEELGNGGPVGGGPVGGGPVGGGPVGGVPPIGGPPAGPAGPVGP